MSNALFGMTDTLHHTHFAHGRYAVEEWILKMGDRHRLVWVREPMSSMVLDDRQNVMVHVDFPLDDYAAGLELARGKVAEKFDEYWKTIPEAK